MMAGLEVSTFELSITGISDTSLTSSISIGTRKQLGVIKNDDFAKLTLSGEQSQEEGDEGLKTFQFKVKLDGSIPGGFDIEYFVEDISATAGEDYIDNDGVLSFAGFNGEEKIIIVQTKGDLKAEAHEQFEVILGDITAEKGDPAIVIIGNNKVGSIINDDGAVIFLDIGSNLVTEFDTTKQISITLSTLTDSAVSVDYEAVSGSADGGDDFVAVSGTVNFAAGELVKVVEIPIIDDDQEEGEEAFIFSLSNPSKYELGNPASREIVILDNDSTPMVNLIAQIGEVGESDDYYSIELELSHAYALPVKVTLDMDNGTARSGVDFQPFEDVVVFEPGETKQTIQLPILPDSIYERNEDLSISIVKVENGETGEDAEMLLKIIEDDPVPTFSVVDVAAHEALIGLSMIEFEVGISHFSEIDIFIDFETADGTAKAHEDYLPVSGRLRIRAGSLNGVIRVPILGDSKIESPETFQLLLFNSSEGEIDTPSGTITVSGTIEDVVVEYTYLPIIAK